MTKTKRNPKKSSRVFKNPQWNTCYQQFIAHFDAPETRERYDRTLRDFFGDPSKTPDKYSRQAIESFVHAPIKRGRHIGQAATNGVCNGRIVPIQSFYSWTETYLVEYRGKLTPILRGPKPTRGMRALKAPEVERDMDEAEVHALFAAIERITAKGLRDYCLFLTLLMTGRRIAEICRLRWGDLEQAVFLDGAIPRKGWLYHFQGKGHLSRDDCAELPDVCMQALQTYLEACGKWGKMSAGDPLFVGWPDARDWPQEPITTTAVEVRFRRYANIAGIPESRVVHSLRREHAWQRYCANGHDILEVRDHLRHHNVETTMIYINRRKKRQQGDPTASALAAKFARL